MESSRAKWIWFILAITGGQGYATNLAIELYLQDLTNNSIKIVWWTETKTEQNVAHIVDPVNIHQLKLVALPDSGFACPPLAAVSIHQSYWWY